MWPFVHDRQLIGHREGFFLIVGLPDRKEYPGAALNGLQFHAHLFAELGSRAANGHQGEERFGLKNQRPG